MLHKKRKPSTFTSSSGFTDCKRNATSNDNMLHSKSTYFYRWLSNLGVARRSYNSANGKTSSKVGHDFANEFRESSHHCEKGSTTSGTAHAILTRSRRQTNSYSKITDRPGYVVPVECSLTLLLGLGILFNPAMRNVDRVFAVENEDECKIAVADSLGNCAMELAIFMNGKADETFTEPNSTPLKDDNSYLNYRAYSFSVRAVDTAKGYELYAGVVNTGAFGNNLINADYPEEKYNIKALEGENVAYANIPENTWGYAITSNGAAADTLIYNALPTATTTTTDGETIMYGGKLVGSSTTDTGYDPSAGVGQDKHTDANYTMYFVAKAGNNLPAGHYRTQVMLSVVASPKKVVVGLGGITKMSEMTSAYCASLKTPSVNDEIKQTPTGLLIDDREGDNGTKYWVSKLADGNCWMVQNMNYGTADNSSNSKKVLDGSSAVSIDGYAQSTDPNTTLIFPDDNTYNSHYIIGKYYNQSQAVGACSKAGGVGLWDWKLPTAPSDKSAPNGSFRKLTNTYKITSGTNTGTSSVKLVAAPLFFIYAGSNWPSAPGVYYVGENGRYWSSDNNQLLNIYSSSVDPSNFGGGNGTSLGYSVRCLVVGEI